MEEHWPWQVQNPILRLFVLGADQPVNGMVGPSLGLGVEEASGSIWGPSYLGTEDIIKFDW